MSSFRYRVVLLVGQRGRGVRLPAAQPNYKHFLNQNLQLPSVPPLCFQAVNDIIISWQRGRLLLMLLHLLPVTLLTTGEKTSQAINYHREQAST